jgi:DNA adenine methylase
MSLLDPPLKWHGGKHYLARKIVALMPPHLHYVEPYFGGGAVLLAREPEDPSLWLPHHQGVSEVANDLNGRLINFWRVLKVPATFEQFRRTVEAIPLSRMEWGEAHSHHYDGKNPLADAVAFFIDCRQSRSGLMRNFTPLTRTRTRRRMNGNVSEWLTAVDGLAEIHARLRRVCIENMAALDLIRREDTPATLFYCDPPYLHETRESKEAYAFEMTEQDHRELLSVLKSSKGKIMLSGYPSALYEEMLSGWSRYTFDLPNNVARGAQKERETEVLWCNY